MRVDLGNPARRRDNHQKIKLGGLVVKAGLRNADAGFLLGVLLHAASLEPGSPEYEALRFTGRDALLAPDTRQPE